MIYQLDAIYEVIYRWKVKADSIQEAKEKFLNGDADEFVEDVSLLYDLGDESNHDKIVHLVVTEEP